MATVTLNGTTYDSADLTGYGYLDDTVGFFAILTAMVEDLDASGTVNNVLPGAAGGLLRSDGTNWVRVSDLDLVGNFSVTGEGKFDGGVVTVTGANASVRLFADATPTLAYRALLDGSTFAVEHFDGTTWARRWSLGAAGTTTFSGAVNFSDTTSHTGAATFASTLSVTGAVTLSSSIRVPNNTAYKARNAANTADVDLVSLDTSDRLTLNANSVGLAIVNASSAGTAGAVAGYLNVMVSGTAYKIPLHAV